VNLDTGGMATPPFAIGRLKIKAAIRRLSLITKRNSVIFDG
jgi:hypothetical protein